MDMDAFMIRFCYHMITICPCILLCYIPFKNQLRRRASRIAIETISACIASSVVQSILYVTFGFDENGNINIAIFMLAGFFYYRKTVQEGLQKLLFVFCVAVHTGSICGGIEVCVYMFLGISANQRGISFLILILLQNVIVYSIVICLLNKFFTPRLLQIESRNMKWLWSIPVVFSLILIYYYTDYFIKDEIDYLFPSLVAFLAVTSFFVYIALLHMLDSAIKNVRLESEITLINRQFDLQRQQYKIFMENAEIIKAMRHDMRHHIAVIKSYNNVGDREKLGKYIDNIIAAIPTPKQNILCENFAVNAVVVHYLELAKSEGFSTNAQLDVPEDTGCICAVDLCVIIGNFLENAVEACRRMHRGEKFIQIRSRIDGGTLSMVVVNSFDGVYCKENGIYLSRKNNCICSGKGLASIKAACEKYNGLLQFEINQNIWKSFALVDMNTACTTSSIAMDSSLNKRDASELQKSPKTSSEHLLV